MRYVNINVFLPWAKIPYRSAAHGFFNSSFDFLVCSGRINDGLREGHRLFYKDERPVVLPIGMIRGKIPALLLLYLSKVRTHGDVCRHFLALTAC